MEKEVNKIESENNELDSTEIEMQFLRIIQVKAMLETLGEAVYYSRDYVSEENVYHSLNLAAEELERVKDNLYNLVFYNQQSTDTITEEIDEWK